jgi:hypothetical protein
MITCNARTRLFALIATCAIAGAAALGPAAGGSRKVSLARVDPKFLTTFLAARNEEPFIGGHFFVEEDGQPQSAEAAKDCRERRNFRLLRSLENVATPDGSTAWSEYARYSIMLCEHGPLAVDEFESTIDAAMKMITPAGKPLPAELAEFAGFPVRIGDRTGRAAVLLGVGHGVIPAPLAIVPSVDGRTTLTVVSDDSHLGEPGHEVGRTLTELVGLLKAVDERSRPNPSR